MPSGDVEDLQSVAGLESHTTRHFPSSTIGSVSFWALATSEITVQLRMRRTELTMAHSCCGSSRSSRETASAPARRSTFRVPSAGLRAPQTRLTRSGPSIGSKDEPCPTQATRDSTKKGIPDEKDVLLEKEEITGDYLPCLKWIKVELSLMLRRAENLGAPKTRLITAAHGVMRCVCAPRHPIYARTYRRNLIKDVCIFPPQHSEYFYLICVRRKFYILTEFWPFQMFYCWFWKSRNESFGDSFFFTPNSFMLFSKLLVVLLLTWLNLSFNMQFNPLWAFTPHHPTSTPQPPVRRDWISPDLLGNEGNLSFHLKCFSCWKIFTQ